MSADNGVIFIASNNASSFLFLTDLDELLYSDVTDDPVAQSVGAVVLLYEFISPFDARW
jgi:hypothetical protein